MSEIDASLRAEMDAHAEENQLGVTTSAALHCCDTSSVRLKKPGLMSRLTGSADSDTEHRTVVLVTPRYLIVAVAGENRGVHVSSARLDAISIESYRLAAEIDSGVSATGVWSDGHAGSRYVGLGENSDGRAFLDQLRTSIAEAKSA
ncbi:hypothetical protein [Streptomyces sp. NPDC060002]|uniref:hypothetical protein n=1 Tax=Streptomyces sp. NPDC060002 TaxID=3347033 RepID=UPI00369DDA81